MPILKRINEAWFSLLEWLEEKGLPFKSLADSLEEKGIPSLPAALASLTTAAALLYLFLIAPALAPPTADVTVYVKTAEGNPVDNATVRTLFEEPCLVGALEKTTFDGQAKFEDVPALPCPVKITAVHYAYETPEAQALTLEPLERKDVFFTLAPRIPVTVSLAVNVEGPPKARVYLYDAAGSEVAVKEGTTLYFEVAPNATYTLRGEASGYRSESKDIAVSFASPVETLTLFELGAEKAGTLRVMVADSEGKYGRPLANATVQVFDASTNRVAKNLLTGSNGEVEPQKIAVGKKIFVLALATGFLPRKSDVFEVKAGENPVRLNLVRSTAENTFEVTVKVLDEARKAIASPVVRLWKAASKEQELVPADGVARFKVRAGERFAATAHKPGFLPNYVGEVSRGEYEVILEKTTALNAGKAKVRVSDAENNDVVGADVALYRVELLANRSALAPLGLLEKQTSLSGYALFEDVPLELVAAKASSAGRVGESTPTRITAEGAPGENASLIEVKLSPGKGKIFVNAVDRFSGKPVEGAVVKARGLVGANENSSSECVSKEGKCVIEVIEGNAEVTVAKEGFDFYSTKVLVTPGEQSLEANLISVEAARTTKLDFLGLYDLAGKKVSSLAPATTYVAKYVLRSPPFGFNKASALVSIGSQDRSLEEEAASITGWNAPGAKAYAGVGFEAPQAPVPEMPVLPSPLPTPTQEAAEAAANATPATAPAQVVASPTATPAPAGAAAIVLTSVGQAASNAAENKWVSFEFPSFQGSKEIAVQIRTKAVSKASVELMHRAAWFTAAEAIRDPVDAEAGVTKHELLANLASSGKFEVEFEGACDSSVCLQAWIESEGTKHQAEGFEALVPTEFKLAFKVLSPLKEASVKLSVASQAVEVKEGVSGAKTASLTATEVSQDASLDVLIAQPAGAATGFFTIAPKRASKDVPITLAAEAREGGRVETTSAIRVVHPKPKLVVTVIPKEIQALKPTTVVFRVRDAFDLPVENAHVTLGSEEDALGNVYEAFNAEEATQPKGPSIKPNLGSYRIDNVEAKKTGFAKYVVEAEGFKLAKGEIPVTAVKLVAVEPEKISLSVNSKLYSTAQVAVRNLLDQEVLATFSVAKNSVSKYTTVSMETTSIKLKPMESKAINFRAKVSDSVPDVAVKATQVKESVEGFLRASARISSTPGAAGAGRQQEDVPYSVSTLFTQAALSDLWSLSTETIAVRLEPPQIPFRTEKIVVYNNAPAPILINQMSVLPHVAAEPLSMSIPPGESAELTLHFSALPEYLEQGKCIMDDKRFDLPGLTLAASYQGVVSKKAIRVTLDISSSENCRPFRPVGVALPVNALFTFPAGTKVKHNTDGSTAVLTGAARAGRPSEEQRMLFHPGAVVTESYASVPAGVGIEVTQSLASYDADKDEWAVAFPTQLQLVFGAETTLPTTLAKNTRVIVGSQQLVLPAGATVAKGSPTALAAPPKPTPPAYAYPGWAAPVPAQAYVYPYGAPAAAYGAAYGLPGVPAYVSYVGYPPYAPPAAAAGYYYGSPYSLYDPTRYGYPDSVSSMYSYARQPGAKHVTIPAYARISLRMLEFYSGDENSVVVPAGLALLLPKDAVVARDEYDQTFLVSFPNGDVLKSSQTSEYDKASKTLKIPANTEWHAPKRWILRGDALSKELKEVALVAGEEAFALKLPFDSRISYPASVKDPYKEVGLWILEIEAKRKALAFTYEVKPIQVGAVKEVAVEKAKPFVVLYGGSAKSFLLGEAVVEAPEKIVVPGDFEYLTVKLPPNTRFEPGSGEARTAVLPDCSRVELLFKDGSRFKTLPATRKIGFENADYSDKTRVKVLAGKAFTPFLCAAAEEAERVQTICFPSPVAIGVPPTATKGGEGGYNTITVAGCEGVNVTINSEKPPSSNIAFGTTKIKALKEISEVYHNTTLNLLMLGLQKKGCVDFYVCKDYGKEALQKGAAVWAGAGTFGFVNASLPAVELNNEVRSKKIKFQFYNTGKTTLTIDALSVQSARVTPSEYGDALDYRSVVPSQAWGLSFEKSLKIPPVTAGGVYEAEATVKMPADLLDGLECVAKEAEFVAEVEFTAKEPGSTTPFLARLYIPVKVTRAGTCFAKKTLDASAVFSGVFVTNSFRLENKAAPAQPGKKMLSALAFKGLGNAHARPLAIANNRLSDVEVDFTTKSFASVLKCSLDRKGTKLVERLEVKFGRVATVFCWPRENLLISKDKPLVGFIELDSLEEATGRVLATKIKVIVFNPGAEATALYSATPWGEPAPGAEVPRAAAAEASLLSSSDELSELSPEEAPIEVPANSFFSCAAHYCNYELARTAVADFAVQVQKFLNDTMVKGWPSGALGYCDYLQKFGEKKGGKYRLRRSVVLNLQNVRSPQGFEDEVKELLKGRFEEVTVEGRLEGCGVYSLEGFLEVPCPALQKDVVEKALKERIAIEIEKKAGCDETVANAALLLPEKETEVIVGKRLAALPQELLRLAELEKPVLGNYGNEDDERDSKTAKELSKTLFNKELPLKGAERYSNIGLCLSTASRVLATMGLYGAGVVAPLLIPPLTPAGVFLGKAMLSRVPGAVTGCVAGGVAGLAWGVGAGLFTEAEFKDAPCTALNWCVEGVLFGFTSRAPGIPELKKRVAASFREGLTLKERIKSIFGKATELVESQAAKYGEQYSSLWQAVKDAASKSFGVKLSDEETTALVFTAEEILQEILREQNLKPDLMFEEGPWYAGGKEGGILRRSVEKAAKAAGKLSAPLEIALGILAVVLIDVDVMPVRAELNQSLTGHVAVYHVEKKLRPWPVSVPTMVEACKGSKCSPHFVPYLGLGKHECPVERDACVSLVKIDEADKAKGYLLLASVNKEGLDSTNLFTSLFTPHAKSVEVNARASTAPDLSKIKYEEGVVTQVEQSLGELRSAYLDKVTRIPVPAGLSDEENAEISAVKQRASDVIGKAGGEGEMNAAFKEAEEQVKQVIG